MLGIDGQCDTVLPGWLDGHLHYSAGSMAGRNQLGVFTENLLENTDGVLRPPSVFSRDGSMPPSSYADVCCIDDVIAF